MTKSDSYWDVRDVKPSEPVAEYGSVGGVRFLNPENVSMHDGNGDIILCKCGKPAGAAAMGRNGYAAWCTDCSPLHKEQAAFVYREPTEEQKKKFDGILSPDWIVNLKECEDA